MGLPRGSALLSPRTALPPDHRARLRDNARHRGRRRLLMGSADRNRAPATRAAEQRAARCGWAAGRSRQGAPAPLRKAAARAQPPRAGSRRRRARGDVTRAVPPRGRGEGRAVAHPGPAAEAGGGARPHVTLRGGATAILCCWGRAVAVAVRDSPSESAGNAVSSAPCSRRPFGRSPPTRSCRRRVLRPPERLWAPAAPRTGPPGGSRPPRSGGAAAPRPTTQRGSRAGPGGESAPARRPPLPSRCAVAELCPALAGARASPSPSDRPAARGCQAAAGRSRLLAALGVGGRASRHAELCEFPPPQPARALGPARTQVHAERSLCPARSTPGAVRCCGLRKEGRKELVER